MESRVCVRCRIRRSKNTARSQEAGTVSLSLCMAVMGFLRLLNFFNVYVTLIVAEQLDWERKQERDSQFMHLWLLRSSQTSQKASTQGCNWVIIQEWDYPVHTELCKNRGQTYNQEDGGEPLEWLLNFSWDIEQRKTTRYYDECCVCLVYLSGVYPLCSDPGFYKGVNILDIQYADPSHKACLFYESVVKSDWSKVLGYTGVHE